MTLHHHYHQKRKKSWWNKRDSMCPCTLFNPAVPQRLKDLQKLWCSSCELPNAWVSADSATTRAWRSETNGQGVLLVTSRRTWRRAACVEGDRASSRWLYLYSLTVFSISFLAVRMTVHKGQGHLSCSVSHRRNDAMEVVDSPLNLVSFARGVAIRG